MASEEKSTISRHRRGAGSIDLTTILQDVLRQWWVIILAGITAALLFGAYRMATYAPRYSASTVFIVQTSEVSSNPIADNLNAADTMTENFTSVVNSNILKNRVCQELGLSSLDASIQVTAVEGSNLMTLTVVENNPQQTYRIILSVMAVAEELCADLTENISISVLQPPAVPTRNINPLNLRSRMQTTAVIGALVMALLFAFMSYQKDTIKTEDDVKAKVDSKLLGSIPHERKAKTPLAFFRRKQYSMRIDNPTLSFGYVEAIQLAATRTRLELDKTGGKVLVVTSVTENEGKSTVAANLALSLSKEGRKVALLDCDFYKPSQYKIFGMDKAKLLDYDFGSAVRNHTTVRMRQTGLSKKLLAAFSVVPSSKLLRKQDVEYLAHILETLRAKMDYIIVDSSPFGLVAEIESIATICDASVLVVEQNSVEARFINDTIDQLNETSGKVVGCIFNNVYPTIFGSVVNSQTPYGYGYGGYGYGGYGYGSGYGSRKNYGYGKHSRKSGSHKDPDEPNAPEEE